MRSHRRPARADAGDRCRAPDHAADDSRPGGYEPPRVTYLGTLRDLTLGGTTGPDDGVGGAGGVGSL